MSLSCWSVRPIVSRPFRRHVRTNGSISNAITRPVGIGDRLGFEVDRDVRAFSDRGHQRLHVVRGQREGDEPDLDRVREEDVAERRRDHDVEAVVLQRPRGVFPRRAAAEVRPGDEDPGAGAPRPVQLEVGVLPPVVEEELAVARALDALEELLRDDLVGVDVGPVEDDRARGERAKRLHARAATDSRTSTKCPASAAAAAIAGLTRCVRPPLP